MPSPSLRCLLVGLALAGAATTSGPARAESPAARSVAAQEAVVRAGDKAAERARVEASRVKFGHADLYVPTFFQPVAGTYDLVVHFHGIPSLQEDNFERAHVNAIVVSVNLGLASDAYSGAFRAPGSFDVLLQQTQHALDQTGRAPGATLGRIALSAWSAGFASVGAILKQPGVADRIDAVLLADGPHTMYDRPHHIYEPGMEKWVRFAEAAMRGEKLFALTHSSIQTLGYPSTTETIGELLRETSVEKTPTDATGPRGMRGIYESHWGSFHVGGYEGQTAKDHIDHIKGMAETLLPYLRARWSSPSAGGDGRGAEAGPARLVARQP
ncbi:MAG TPA: hypothetical protein VHS09_08190 [Polyangiaceae bacterium]|nr:hypothetical protein [Polyangiaceae bacterium]